MSANDEQRFGDMIARTTGQGRWTAVWRQDRSPIGRIEQQEDASYRAEHINGSATDRIPSLGEAIDRLWEAD